MARSVSWPWSPWCSRGHRPSLPIVPGTACQGRLAWGEPRVWKSCQKTSIPPGPRLAGWHRDLCQRQAACPGLCQFQVGAGGWSCGLGGTGEPGQVTLVPGVALLERHQCVQFLPTAVGIRCCVGLWRSPSWSQCHLFPQPPQVRVVETEGWGTLQNTASCPSPCPLRVTTLGQPCPGIWVGRGLPGTGRGEHGSPPNRTPRPRCQNPPLAAAASGRSGQGKDAWNSCPGAERDRSKY